MLPNKGCPREPNVVLISMQRPFFAYVDIAAKLLKDELNSDGVILKALGTAINHAVNVAEILTQEGIARVTKIETGRGGGVGSEGDAIESNRLKAPRIAIHIVKTEGFEELFEQMLTNRSDYRRTKAMEALVGFVEST